MNNNNDNNKLWIFGTSINNNDNNKYRIFGNKNNDKFGIFGTSI